MTKRLLAKTQVAQSVDLLRDTAGGETIVATNRADARLPPLQPVDLAGLTAEDAGAEDSPLGAALREPWLVDLQADVGAVAPEDDVVDRILRDGTFVVLTNGTLGDIVAQRLAAAGADVRLLLVSPRCDPTVARRQQEHAPLEFLKCAGASALEPTDEKRLDQALAAGARLVVALEGVSYPGLDRLDTWLAERGSDTCFVTVDRGNVIVGPAGGPSRPASPTSARVLLRVGAQGQDKAELAASVLGTSTVGACRAWDTWPARMLFAIAALFDGSMVPPTMVAMVTRTSSRWLAPSKDGSGYAACSSGLMLRSQADTEAARWSDRPELFQVDPFDEGAPRSGRQAGEALVSAAGADLIPHAVGSFKDHLVEVRRILERWGQPPAICDAGLLHSAYGTRAFTREPSLALVDFADAPLVASAVGEAAEGLVFLFCTIDRSSLNAELRRRYRRLTPARLDAIPVTNRFTHETAELPARLAAALCVVEMANLVEQVGPGGVGTGLSFAALLGRLVQPCVGRVPPAFDGCAGTLTADDERAALDAYESALQSPQGSEARTSALRSATLKNPWVGEPWLRLASELRHAERFDEARDAARRGSALLRQLGASWDKAATLAEWLRDAAVSLRPMALP